MGEIKWVPSISLKPNFVVKLMNYLHRRKYMYYSAAGVVRDSEKSEVTDLDDFRPRITRLDPWGHARPAVRICHHHRTYLCTNIAGSYRMLMATILVSEACNCYNQVNTTLSYIDPWPRRSLEVWTFGVPTDIIQPIFSRTSQSFAFLVCSGHVQR